MAVLRQDHFYGRVIIEFQDGTDALLGLERTFKNPREALRVLTAAPSEARAAGVA